MAARKVKLALLGAGRIGQLHGTNIQNNIPNAEIIILADPYLSDQAKEWAAGVGIPVVTTNPDEVFANPEVEAVFICSSTPTHADFIKKAAAAGKHVFCEMPIDTDIDKIKDAIDAVEKAGVKLQVGFVRRFDHNHKKVCDVVASGKLGAPNIVKVTSRDPAHQSMDYIKISGGIFMDMTIHDFDMARYLAGSDVTEVMAYGAALSGEGYDKYGDVDNAIVMMKFENGAIGVIDNTRASHYGYDQRTEVQCDKGCVQVSNDLNNQAMISSAEGVEIAKPTWFFLERYNDAFCAEDQAFIDAIIYDTETPVGARDGLAPVEMAIAAAKSLKEGRPVKISEIR